jgi:hypothetical protein
VFTRHRDDSDDISITHAGAEGEYVLNPEIRLWLGGDRWWLDAPRGSGFETIGGNEDIEYTRAWIGGRYLVSSNWSLDAELGGGYIEDGDNEFVYEAGTDIWPSDKLAVRLSRRQDVYMVSPRTVSLGILRRNNQINWSWSPNLRYTVDGVLGYSTFTDDNTRWDLGLAPRRVIVRTEHLNLDVGVSGYWFGFDRNPSNGYYSPSLYRRFTANLFGYWKIDGDNGVSLALSVGAYKDDIMDDYDAAVDLVVDGFFGIYRDWMLNVSASLSQNGGVSTGAFQEWAFGLSLTRRF